MAEGRDGDLLVARRGGVLEVTFNRPAARNALTWSMYEGLVAACELADRDVAIRVMVLRGAGERAFVAGTDIAQFDGFTGADGAAYEARITAVLERLLSVSVPVIAAVRGYCVGGGLALAACADIRIAEASARFGVPIARTLGNTLSASSLRLLEAQLGRSRVASLLLTARMLSAEEALAAGFVTDIAADVDAASAELAERLEGYAPLTMWATKELLRRTAHRAGDVDDSDVVERVYGSADFAGAVAAFGRGEAPRWTGR